MPESLDQLDLLLMQAVCARKIRRGGIYFQSLRYRKPVELVLSIARHVDGLYNDGNPIRPVWLSVRAARHQAS